MTSLLFPRLAAVSGGDDRAERSHSPTHRRILRCEGDREKMIAHTRVAQQPFAAAVRRRHYDAARAADNHARAVFDVHPVERRVGGALLFLPFEAAVVSAEDDAVRTDGPTAGFVWRKSDGVDRVALREWILPLPATQRVLRFT